MPGAYVLGDVIPTTFDISTLEATIDGLSFDEYFQIHDLKEEDLPKIRRLARWIKDYIGFDIRRRQAVEKTIKHHKGRVALERLLAYAATL